MNHVMGYFYSETQFEKDLELNVVRIWVLRSVSLPKPARSLFRKELENVPLRALASPSGTHLPLVTVP